MGRNRRTLARYSATRVVGLTALCGLVALGLGALESGEAAVAALRTSTTPGVATSADFDIDLQLALPGHLVIALHGDGQADFATHDATMSVDLPSAGLHAAAGQALTSADSPAQLDTRWVDGVVYLAVPTGLAALAGGATSLSYRVPTATARTVDTAMARSAVALTYARILVGTLTRKQAQHAVGTRTIDGVGVSGTQIDLTLSQLLKVIPGLAPAVARVAKALGSVKIPTTIWVDHAGRLIEATMAAGPSTSDGSLSGSVRFSHYNGPVTIAAPAPGTVHTMPKSVLALLKTEDPFGGAG
jgi:hypothetical protein